MIEVNRELMVDEDKMQDLRRMAEGFMDMEKPEMQAKGQAFKFVLAYLDLWDSSDKDTKEDDSMKEMNTNLADEIAAMEERDRLKSLLDRIETGDMGQKEAVAYALAYFDGVSDMDADKPYTAGDILSLMHALYKCEA